MSTTKNERIAALSEFAAESGIILPWPVDVIAQMEEKGHVIDLSTGMIIQNGAEQRVTATVIGEATAIVNKRGLF